MNQSDIRMRQNVCRRLSAARRRQKYEPGLRLCPSASNKVEHPGLWVITYLSPGVLEQHCLGQTELEMLSLIYGLVLISPGSLVSTN